MADNIGITRVPTNEEMQDYSQLSAMTPKEMFLIELSKVEANFTREHKPFDSQCAKLDFSDKIEDMEKESQRKYGFVRQSDLRHLKFNNLEKYGDISRFEIQANDEDIEMQNVNNTRTAVVVGHTVKYVCKDRKHGCSVFIPLELYKERFEKNNKDNKDKKE